MTAGMNYITLRESLLMKKQMCLLFCCTFYLSDTCQHSVEGDPTICVLSNIHSVIKTKHGP